ncbi:recombinase family protein [Parabacteroides sp. FAFU027]|uniref:recombinase family protein n=1 Tax=Parabacteroides sp. FAFU027 TaxID=2922715 RepID=UPI001FAFB55C|nr:recombinase family protein [Parabacteroides sp. FAFU027]
MRTVQYIRVSTTNQDVIRQKEKLKTYCERENYTVVDIITDFGISGSTFERDGFKKLMDITSKDADIVIVSELSRLSRKEEILETLNSVQNIISKGIKLVFLDNPSKVYEGSLDIMEILTLSLAAYLAAEERKAIKTRNQEGKKALFKNTPYALVDGKIPYGFKKVVNPAGNHPKYIIDYEESECDVIRKIFQMIMEGKSVAQVMHFLHNSGIRHNDDVIFNRQFLSKLFSNEIYKGIRRRKNETAYIKAIIEPEIWDTVQVKIKENHLYQSRGTIMFNPLKGIIRCRCGRAMMIKNKSDGLYVYRCSDVQPQYMPNRCEYHDSIRFELTNEVIFALFKSLDFIEIKGKFADKIADLEIQINGIEKQIKEDKKETSTLKDEIEILGERYMSAKSQLLADKVQENILKKEDEAAELHKRILQKEDLITRLKNQIQNLNEVSKDEDFENLNINERAEIFRKYLKEVQYLPKTQMQGFYRVQYISGMETFIAVKKTKSKPIFAVLPDAFKLNDKLNIEITGFTNTNSGNLYDLSAVRKTEITIQKFFNSYSDVYPLDVDLSYRQERKNK